LPDLNAYLENNILKRFHDAWQVARADERLPRRIDISLQLFARFVPNMAIYQRFGRCDIRYRQVGEAVRLRVDGAKPGVNIFELLDPSIFDISEPWWNGLFDQPCGGISEYSSDNTDGAARRMVSLLLPVRRDTTDERLLVGYNRVLAQTKGDEPFDKFVVGKRGVSGYFLDVGFGCPPQVE